MIPKIKVLRVWSDNIDGILFTQDAYNELKLSMSSGDYGSHKIEDVEVEDYHGVVTLSDLYQELNDYEIERVNNSLPSMYSSIENDFKSFPKYSSEYNVIHVDFKSKIRLN